MGNFLIAQQSLNWENSIIDRGLHISELNSVITTIRGLSDEIFRGFDLNQLDLTWGNLLEFVFANAYDDQLRVQRFPWMTQMQHTTLVYLLSYLSNVKSITPNNLAALIQQTATRECCDFGFPYTEQPNLYVHSEDTLTAFHRNIVSKFNYASRRSRYKYFKAYFKPCLIIPLNQINDEIINRRCNNSFERIDPAVVVGEKIHIHFGGRYPCALNVDGTWKHPNASFTIPQQAREELCVWGFELPPEYY